MAQTIRKLRVVHTTRYTYDKPVQRSVHRLHLCPINDWDQRVLAHTLSIKPEVPIVEYEDVFGNWVTTFELNEPYTELVISADSLVDLLDTDPFSFAQKKIHPSFPLAWMPWEQAMLAPYLRPIELPDTELQELYDYAMSFVEKNERDLMETLFAINLALFRDYKYEPGSTNLMTTPYDVFVNKKGVCQTSPTSSSAWRGSSASRRGMCAGTSSPATPATTAPRPTRRTRGCSFTSPTSAGRASTRRTASCRTPATSASGTGGTTAT